ncbi:hypothetical protein [Deinococcus misasensis]|uniref:hypothetical protein n=1 Tax=Deinococcus misasensis TaxID=392413 RepID=UPI0012F8E40F|nr:hypothetical protein [Deinococcus misasensis]
MKRRIAGSGHLTHGCETLDHLLLLRVALIFRQSTFLAFWEWCAGLTFGFAMCTS